MESEPAQDKEKLGFLGSNAAELTALFDDPDAKALEPGDVIGRYELLEKIGEGGFGSVWKARQLDVVREVALKLIRPSNSTPEALSRFERERQALAMMEHDHIAKVYEAGVHDGSLFLAMEYIPGDAITHYVTEKKLTLRERIALFIPICRAINHAHQKFVLHRDLKPANLLVTVQDGAPIAKVIDFGIAKPLTGEHRMLTADTGIGPVTLPGYRLGTPQYMSPEQARGADTIDAASDTYSLGIVLYELLVGEPPVTRSDLAALRDDHGRLEHVATFEPSLPSTLWLQVTKTNSRRFDESLGRDPRRISRELRGDIDWIIHKALEKEPSRRYASADHFASDLQRYLDNEPVSVGPPSMAYKLRKFYLRNTAATLGSVAVLAAILVGGGVAVWQWQVALQARDAEVVAHQLTEKALTAEELARKEAEEARGKEAKARQASDRARAEAEELIAFNLYDMRESLEPLNQTELLTKVAVRAEQYLTSISNLAGETAEQSKSRAAMYQNKGLIELVQGKREAALASFQAAFGVMKQRVETHPQETGAQRDLATLHSRLGMAYQANGKPTEAEREYQQEQAIVLSFKKAPDSTTLQYQLATSYEHFGDLSDNPLPLYTQELELAQRLSIAEPESTKVQRLLATAHGKVASALRHLNKPNEALAHSEEELRLLGKLKAENPQDVRIQRSELVAFQNQACTLLAANQALKAEPILQVTLAKTQTIAQADPKNAQHQEDLANMELLWVDCQRQLAGLGLLSGDPAKIKAGKQRLLKAQALLKARRHDNEGKTRLDIIAESLAELQKVPPAAPLNP